MLEFLDMPKTQKYTIGALCAGYGGLELGLREVLETKLVWFSEIDPNATKVDIFENNCPRRRVHVLRMYRTSVLIKQYYGGEILETVPVLTLNWYYCAPLDFGLRVPVSPGHLVFSQVPGYFVYRYIRTAIRYKSQVLYLQVPVCKHRNVYRCLQIYKRIMIRSYYHGI